MLPIVRHVLSVNLFSVLPLGLLVGGCVERSPDAVARAVVERFAKAVQAESVSDVEALLGPRLHDLRHGGGLREEYAMPREALLNRYRVAFARCGFETLGPSEIVDMTRVDAVAGKDMRSVFGGTLAGMRPDDLFVRAEVPSEARTRPDLTPTDGGASCLPHVLSFVLRQDGDTWRIVSAPDLAAPPPAAW